MDTVDLETRQNVDALKRVVSKAMDDLAEECNVGIITAAAMIGGLCLATVKSAVGELQARQIINKVMKATL